MATYNDSYFLCPDLALFRLLLMVLMVLLLKVVVVMVIPVALLLVQAVVMAVLEALAGVEQEVIQVTAVLVA